ncbi:DNA replication/repair protein RecF [Candidatus Dependentiae bacterium]|nr:DNA replication/repair protein RecF [Candidatus Dependentiae bacterium]
MFLHHLEIRKFRCFSYKEFIFSKQFTLIIGNNGTGKTSLAEAIYYLCYMKSFRSHNVNDLIEHKADSFFLKGTFTNVFLGHDSNVIQVGYSNKKKAIKLNSKSITTYKELFENFQSIILMEDDIYLIKGSPSERRSFIDQAALFLNSTYAETYRNFKRIVQQRNSFLQNQKEHFLESEIWTEKLWAASITIQDQRQETLSQIEEKVNGFLIKFFDAPFEIHIQYDAIKMVKNEVFSDFKIRCFSLFEQEKLFKRSLFGAHLDDFHITIKNHNARFFASRGQQKLVSLLCKLALMDIAKQNSYLPVLIIDDFIADFDSIKLIHIMKLLSFYKNQVIIITPFYDEELKKIIGSVDPDVIFMKNEFVI